MLRLHYLVQAFGLDQLDVDALLIALAPSLDLRYEQIYSYLQNDISKKRPSVGLILGLLCRPGVERLQGMTRFDHDSPLIRHGLLEMVHEPGTAPVSLLAQKAVVHRTVVSWLLGKYEPDDGISPFIHLEFLEANEERTVIAGPILSFLQQAATVSHPILLFHGPDQIAQEAAAQTLAGNLAHPLLTVDFSALLGKGMEALGVLRMVLRDARLYDAVVHLRGWDACVSDDSAPPYLLRELYDYPNVVILEARQFWQPQGLARSRTVLSHEFGLPDYTQRKTLWNYYLRAQGAAHLDLDPILVAGQFALTTGQIRDAVAASLDQAIHRGEAVQQQDLFVGARSLTSARLAGMARKIVPRYEWEDIILPQDQLDILLELVSTVRLRSKVLEEWGLGKKLASSAAVTVLFAGPPGTGKTMSAEVLAKDLGLDLYKIDLASLVSKYIGETEKNLEQVFVEAQSSNAILFFDEADAIFGKRSGVKDARDRYANLEISYLLQRMEMYDGVTILATNLRSNIDEAFIRRLQFAIDIPFPDEKDRLRIWEALFPKSVPRADDVDLGEIARRFKLAGGNIRNILMSAAYLAADDGDVIRMQHVLHGTRRELQKMGRLIPLEQMQI